MNDPDISDYLELDMGKVWDEIANVNIAVEGPNGEPIGGDTRDRHGILEKSFLDIGIVRLPDFEKPHVKVCLAHTSISCRSSDAASGFPPQVDGLEPSFQEAHCWERDQGRYVRIIVPYWPPSDRDLRSQDVQVLPS